MPEIELYFSGGLTGNAGRGGDEAWSGLCAPLASTSQSGTSNLWTEDAVSGHGLSYACGATGDEVCEEVVYQKNEGGAVYRLLYDMDGENHKIVSPVHVVAAYTAAPDRAVTDSATCVRSGEVRDSGHVVDNVRDRYNSDVGDGEREPRPTVLMGQKLLVEYGNGGHIRKDVGRGIVCGSFEWEPYGGASGALWYVLDECFNVDRGSGHGELVTYTAAKRGRTWRFDYLWQLEEDASWRLVDANLYSARVGTEHAGRYVRTSCVEGGHEVGIRGDAGGTCLASVVRDVREMNMNALDVHKLDSAGGIVWEKVGG